MKKYMIAILTAMLAITLFAACGGGDRQTDLPETVIVTFVQAGQENVTREVEKGGTLTDIPTPAPHPGYTVTWDRTNFENITENITVNATENPNTYTITYVLGDYEGAYISDTIMEVTYDAPFSLYIPICPDNTFMYWVIEGTNTKFVDGIWDSTKSLTLRAVWKFDEDEWTRFH